MSVVRDAQQRQRKIFSSFPTLRTNAYSHMYNYTADNNTADARTIAITVSPRQVN